jgi:diguanylate cyclase (GGDEF)-like protein
MNLIRPPHRVVYPGVGALLSLGAPGGLVILRGALAGVWPGPAWASREVSAHPEIYLYVGLSTMLIFLVLGFILGRKEDLLEALSTTDALTGLCNRRLFDSRLRDELERAARYGTPLTLLLIDVDKLKEINDRGGHEAGDAALRAVAQCLRDGCRTTDLAARYGGDEFAVLAPGIDATRGLELAARLRAGLEHARGRRPGSVTPTISSGISEFDRAERCSPAALCASADGALYEAKALGRNCAVSVPPMPTRLARTGDVFGSPNKT